MKEIDILVKPQEQNMEDKGYGEMDMFSKLHRQVV